MLFRLGGFALTLAWQILAHENTLSFDEAVVSVAHDSLDFSPSNVTGYFGDSCASYSTCNECYSSAFCHWCEADQACHARGSVHGCFSGVSCSRPKKNNDTDDHGCYAQTSCSDCVLSSRFCHWCAHDNACHVVGSMYGCAVGVDCYSNDRCKRDVPEKLHEGGFEKLNILFLLAMVVLSCIIVCCATACWGLAFGIKGAYDDLLNSMNTDFDEDAALDQPLIMREHEEIRVQAREQADATQYAEENGGEADREEGTPREEVNADGDENERIEYTTLIQGFSESEDEDNVTLRASGRRRRTRAADRLYGVCVGCYAMTLFTVVLGLVATVMYYPRVPVYNVCNDAVAWKSLMDSLTSLKVSADFEILMSVANPNRFDVALDMGKGSFAHNGVFVGTFDIPPTTAKANSITDMFIITHLSPEKWEALSLTSDYYRGKLVLDVQARATLRVPAFFDYSYTAALENIVVHVNEMSDRHMCACPTWDQNQTMIDFRTIQF
ncbi:hypothetical protein FisN_4Hh438 [Fistulifera solaris]|uniref:PSI domain-containing protein n=1 Tax=Fistulifera solaris TaxID=1519565 RepID=A0A1Z5KIG8_FISSO|nr:hypothetical protein FisN_4Hh438 [Fistulifera solaris]|eukprot:GAX26059.1 hypothetical protein FisN_4Hh438 [Fistulifera solaris]